MSYRNLIQRKTEEIQEKLLSLGFPKIHTPFTVCKLPKGVAGRAWGHERFEISIDYITKHTDKIISRTVPHELAHMYTSKYFPEASGHGKQWKKFMEAMGCEQSRRHDMSLTDETPQETRKQYKLEKQLQGVFDVIWDAQSNIYNGFIEKKIVATDKSYNKVKKLMQELYGCEMFNVVTPCF